MATRDYSLEEFLHDMSALVDSVPDQKKIFDLGSSYLERLIRHPDYIPSQYRVPSTSNSRRGDHGTYLLHRGDNGLLITAVVWGAGEHAPPHDHHTWGMIGVLDNTITETRFRRLDDKSNPEYAKIEKDRTGTFKHGDVSLLIPDVDEIHQMDNHTDRPTVEVHVYGNDLVGLERCRFNLETGKVSPFVSSKYDNE